MARTQNRPDRDWQASPRPVNGGRRPNGLYVGEIRVTPIWIILIVALIGTVGYIAFALTVRDTGQIPMLAAGAAILGLVFSSLALVGGMSMWRAGVDRRSATSFGMAFVGGISAMIALGCFAFAIVLALLWGA